jgi:hypothetical protein
MFTNFVNLFFSPWYAIFGTLDIEGNFFQTCVVILIVFSIVNMFINLMFGERV